MATSRSYSDACGMGHALDLVGERWAMHVVRELMLGPLRFSDLRAVLPGISTSALTDRLGELERAGLLRRRRLDPPAASWVYELTPYGADLEPIITVLGRWGARSPTHRPDLPLTTTSFVLSLRTNVDAERTAGLTASYALQVSGADLHARVDDGQLSVGPGVAPDTDASLAGTPEAFAGVIYGGRPLEDAARAGDLVVDGDLSAARRFTRLFTLPAPAQID